MFILKSLYHSLMSVKASDADLVRRALERLSVKRIRCASCVRDGCLKRHSRYRRYCIHAVSGRRVEETVSVPLLLCSGCGAVHAAIPDALIPFGSYSVRFVLTVLRAFASRGCTVRAFCEKWQLSPSTVYEWRGRLESQLSEWTAACRRLLSFVRDCLSSEVPCLPDPRSVPDFPELFHRMAGRAFLQGCQRPSRFVPPAPPG